MAFNTGCVFFCSASDYPKFLPFLKPGAPTVYSEFVRQVERYIEQSREQIIVLKAVCSFPDYIAFCNTRGYKTEYASLNLFTRHVWGALPNA